jgi:hypothetical protein
MTQSIKGARDGLFTVCQALYAAATDSNVAPVLVTYGPPGAYQANNIVAVGMATRRPITRPTMGTTRSRNTDAEIEVWISVFVPGAETAQQTATDACEDLIDLLEARFRTSPNETLGDTCREAWVSDVDGPNPAVVTNPETKAVTGRTADAIVTVTASIRYYRGAVMPKLKNTNPLGQVDVPLLRRQPREFLDESLDWNKNIKQGRASASAAASPGPAAASSRPRTAAATSRSRRLEGHGLLLQACFGLRRLDAGLRLDVPAGLHPRRHPAVADDPEGRRARPAAPSTRYTFLGCMVDSFEFDFPNADIATLKTTSTPAT